MGLRSWLHTHLARRGAGEVAAPGAAAPAPEAAAGPAWVEVPPYLPVDPREHPEVCAIAAAIAAGDRPESRLAVRRVSAVNPEHRRVAVIASAIAAADGAGPLAVKRIYRATAEEEHHAA